LRAKLRFGGAAPIAALDTGGKACRSFTELSASDCIDVLLMVISYKLQKKILKKRNNVFQLWKRSRKLPSVSKSQLTEKEGTENGEAG